jgi:hypothetical protein
MSFKITKADGSTEFFKVEKLRRSLRRAGALPKEVTSIVDTIHQELYDGMQTQEIYRRAFSLLREKELPSAARYSLRRALFSLGPTGFPFELLLARLFTAEGYTTKTGVEINGRCALHEIDFAAYNDNHSFVGEAKFHARPGIKTDLQVALYSYARLLDLKGNKICNESYCNIQEFWLVTNTKFTSAVERYAECNGLKLLSWDYPRNNNLHDRLQKYLLYPVTVLQSLTQSQAKILIERGAITCQDIVNKPMVLNYLHITDQQKAELVKEAKTITIGKITSH